MTTLSPQYRSYVDETIALTRSLCIKYAQSILLQNDRLTTQGYYVSDDPTTWKYYCNLAGEYHESDTPMEVVSSDTREPIALTQANLVDHPLTAVDYGPGGNYHRELLERYPHQKNLILRIFNPVDKATAIAADDFTILYYDPQYIHSREITLMSRLQNWVYGYRDRWHVSSMAITDPLYPAAMLHVMWQNLVPAIMNLRLEKCRTPEVSEFHLWTFLGGRYKLNRFREYLTNRQALYLYRNIDYLRHNVGKEKVMWDLQLNITEPVNIAASRFDVTQSDSEIIEQRHCQPLFLKSPYRNATPLTGLNARRGTRDIHLLTSNAAIHNAMDIDDDTRFTDQEVESNVIDHIPTGVVELEVNPQPDELLGSPAQVRLSHWLYLSAIDKSRIVVSIEVGDFGTLTVTAKDAAVLFIMACNMIRGGSIHDPVADVLVRQVVPQVYPTRTVLEGMLPKHLVKYGYVTDALADVVTLPIVSTVAELDLFCQRVSKRHYRHWLATRVPFDGDDKSYMLGLVRHIYRPYLCQYVASGVTYAQWLETIDIPHGSLDEYDYLQLIQNILKEIVGIDLDISGISARHKAMIDILKLLTSYGIVFVDGGGVEAAHLYDYPYIESLDNGFKGTHHTDVEIGLRSYDRFGKGTLATHLGHNENQLKRIPKTTIHRQLTYGLDLTVPMTVTEHYRLELASMDVMNVSFNVTEE